MDRWSNKRSATMENTCDLISFCFNLGSQLYWGTQYLTHKRAAYLIHACGIMWHKGRSLLCSTHNQQASQTASEQPSAGHTICDKHGQKNYSFTHTNWLPAKYDYLFPDFMLYKLWAKLDASWITQWSHGQTDPKNKTIKFFYSD